MRRCPYCGERHDSDQFRNKHPDCACNRCIEILKKLIEKHESIHTTKKNLGFYLSDGYADSVNSNLYFEDCFEEDETF